jgi:hypothetical protein
MAAILALFCSKTFNNVIMIRAPQAANGCPRNFHHLHLLMSNPNILEFANPTTANASLNSNTPHRLKQFQLYLAL